jgi:hypothetical protein
LSWDYVIQRFGIASVLDLGSGSGNASLWFHRKGLRVIAVDGFTESVDASMFPAIRQDLTLTAIYTKVDLVHCQEVVEHIEERFLANLMASLTCGKIILMTHALPGQGGHHHVNCQPQEYWIKQFAARNCSFLQEDTNRVRALAGQEKASYMAQSGLVFVNNSRL